MALNFRPVVRDQQFLLPPDVREWLPQDHLAWFVIDVVDGMDLSTLQASSRLGGPGRAPFDPRVLLAVLVYGYALGQRSSRQLERLCGQDVAFRVITGNEVPDHTTIARFRAAHEDAMSEVFLHVLALCAQAGMVNLGIIAIDGTKIAANAALAANADEARLRATVARIMEEAAAVDAGEDEQFGDARGDELPAKWRGREGRKQRIQDALKELEAEKAREQELSEEQQAKAAEYAAKLAAPNADSSFRPGRRPSGSDRVNLAELTVQRQRDLAAGRIADRARRKAEVAAAGRILKGRDPKPVEEHTHVRRALRSLEAEIARAAQGVVNDEPIDGAKLQRNMTDPQSRIMKTQKGWVQGFNAQLAVTDDQIILAAQATQDTNDQRQLVPMMMAAATNAAIVTANRTIESDEAIGVIVADAGYCSEANLQAPGPDRLIALGKEHANRIAATNEPTSGPPPPTATPTQAMSHRLRTKQGAADYGRRKVLVEPVNGHIKDRIGLRVFARRGLQAANSELQLASAVANLLKLHRHQPD